MMPERQPIFRLLLLALLLGLGIHVVLFIAWAWGVSVCGNFLGDEGVYEDFAVLEDGTPVIIFRSGTDYQDREGKTLEGKPVDGARLDMRHFAGSLPGLKLPPRQFARVDWSDRMVTFSDNRSPANLWYFIHTGRKEGQGYFEGFDGITKLRVGYIGRNGPLSTKPSSEECFAVDGRQLRLSGRLVPGGEQSADGPFAPLGYSTGPGISLLPWKPYLVCGDELLEVDLGARTVRVLRKFKEPFSIGICRRAIPLDEETDFGKQPWCRDHLAVRTLDRITLIDPRTDAQRVYQIPAEARENQFSFYEFADGTGMLHVARRSENGVWPMDLYWLDDTGEFVREAHLELACGGPPMDPRLAIAGSGLKMPVPVVWTVASFVAAPWSLTYSGKEPGYWAALARSLGGSWPALLVSLAITGVAVWWCIKRQQRYAAGWTRTWVVFIALLGLPAFLGYLLHRRWPVRVECPACHEPAPRDRLSCSACDADFPKPASEGIEVFA